MTDLAINGVHIALVSGAVDRDVHLKREALEKMEELPEIDPDITHLVILCDIQHKRGDTFNNR